MYQRNNWRWILRALRPFRLQRHGDLFKTAHGPVYYKG
jgi:hypothetical protein